MPEIGREGQLRIARARVFIVGCGALGSMVAMQLAGAGVGEIEIADFDTVDVSNLQRQFFFTTAGCGSSKAEMLAEAMRALNPDVRVTVHNQMVTPRNAPSLFAAADFILDGSDNPDTKYMTERVCTALGKPCCLAGVSGFSGQVMTVVPGSTLFSEVVPQGASGGFTPCSIGGVAGPAAAVAASMQAAEAIKWITGAGEGQKELLTDALLTFNLSSGNFSLLRV